METHKKDIGYQHMCGSWQSVWKILDGYVGTLKNTLDDYFDDYNCFTWSIVNVMLLKHDTSLIINF